MDIKKKNIVFIITFISITLICLYINIQQPYKKDVFQKQAKIQYYNAAQKYSTIQATLSVNDIGGSGIKSMQYAWSTSNTTEPTSWTNFVNGQTVTKTDCTSGKYYLWTKVLDNVNNRGENAKISQEFNVVDTNSKDKITFTSSTTNWTNQNVTVTVNYGEGLEKNKKAGFGLTPKEAFLNASLETLNEIITDKNGYIYAEACDKFGNKIIATYQITNIDKEAPKVSTNRGTSLFSDTTFKEGSNSVVAYNNANNGAVTVQRVAASSDIPTDSDYMIEVKTNGTAALDMGGIVQFCNTEASRVYRHKIIAKIPKGYRIERTANSCGTGAIHTWFTSQEGTGEWEVYEYETKCGDSGTFGTLGHIYLKAVDSNVSKTEVTWNIAYADIMDLNSGGALLLNKDVSFSDGFNGAAVYNNAANGTVTINRVAASYDAPTTSKYMMEVQTNGTASPEMGGYCQQNTSTAGGIYRHRIIAKIPKGYTLNAISNSCGTGYTISWLTSQEGTGKWEFYEYELRCGTSGTFSTFGHVYIKANSEDVSSTSVKWQVAYSTVIDTSKFLNQGQIYLNTTDNLSGIDKYGISTSNTEEPPTYYNYNSVSKAAILKIMLTDSDFRYIWIKDRAGNIRITEGDKILPTVELNPNGGIYNMPKTGTATIETVLTAKDIGTGLKTLQYAWSNSSETEPTEWTEFVSGNTVKKTNCTVGTYYLWTKVIDKDGNRAEEVKVSNPFKVNNYVDENLLINIKPNTTKWTNQNVTATITYGSSLTLNKKAGYGKSVDEAQNAATTSQSSSVNAIANGYVYAEATDTLGNKTSKTFEITNIDKEIPTVKNVTTLKQVNQAGLEIQLNGKQNTVNGHDATTTIWRDLSGNDNYGTLKGGTVWSEDSLKLDGTDDWVNLGIINSSYQSMEISFSTPTPQKKQYLFGNWENGGGGIYIVNGRIYVEYYISGAFQELDTGINVVANKIYSVSLTYNGTYLCAYVNGEIKVNKAITGNIGVPANSTVMAIGANPSGVSAGDYANINVYSARVYNKALSEVEVISNYEIEKNDLSNGVKIQSDAQDKISGISQYIYTTDSNISANSNGWIDIENSKELISIEDIVQISNNKYYLYVKDLAGNIGKSQEISQEITVTYNTNYYEKNILDSTTNISKYGLWNVSATASNISDINVLGGKQIKYTVNTGINPSISSTGGPYYATNNDLTPGKVYTYSVFVKSNVTKTMQIGFEQGGIKTIQVTPQWQKITGTFTAQGSGGNRNFVIFSDWEVGNEIYIHSLQCVQGKPEDSFGNILYGLEDKSQTTANNMKYSIKDSVVSLIPNSIDGWGYTSGRVYLEAGKTYSFNAESSSYWEDDTSSGGVEAFLHYEGTWVAEHHFYKQGPIEFTCTKTGTYWLRLDGHIVGQTFTFSNICIKEKGIVQTQIKIPNEEFGPLQTPTSGEYKFVGWYTLPEGGEKIIATDKVPGENINLYAHWVSDPSARAPVITKNPSTVTVTSGNAAVFSVAVTPGIPSTLKYQWYYTYTNSNANGVAMSSSTSISGLSCAGYNSATLELRNIQTTWNAYYVYCEVSNGSYTIKSTVARINVTQAVHTCNTGGYCTTIHYPGFGWSCTCGGYHYSYRHILCTICGKISSSEWTCPNSPLGIPMSCPQ